MTDWFPAEAAPFVGVGWWAIVGVFAAHGLGCFIRGAFGFGSNMPIVIITTFLLGPHHAVLLALLTTAIAQLHLLPTAIKDVDWPVAKPLMLGLFIGTALGTWLFTILSPEWLVLVLGVLLCVIVLMDALKLIERLTKHIDLRSKKLAAGFAFTGGAMGGLGGGGAFYFLVVYLKHACATATALRGTNVALSVLVMTTRMLVVILAGRLTLPMLVEGVLLTPMVIAATLIGARLFRTTTPKRFFAALQLLLLAGAIALIARGIEQVT
jgi:uncharacterized membrane protein YfcA